MADPGRLRTAYDRVVMAGRAPWVAGGNPTPEESRRQADVDAGVPARLRWEKRFN